MRTCKVCGLNPATDQLRYCGDCRPSPAAREEAKHTLTEIAFTYSIVAAMLLYAHFWTHLL